MANKTKYRFLQIRDPLAIELASERAKKEHRSLANAGAITIIEALGGDCSNSIRQSQGFRSEIINKGVIGKE